MCFNFNSNYPNNPISFLIYSPTSGVSQYKYINRNIFHHYLVDSNEFICILLPFSTIIYVYRAPVYSCLQWKKGTCLLPKFIAMFWFDKYFTCLPLCFFSSPKPFRIKHGIFLWIPRVNIFSLIIYAMFATEQHMLNGQNLWSLEWFNAIYLKRKL